jgi:hypothetical protein
VRTADTGKILYNSGRDQGFLGNDCPSVALLDLSSRLRLVTLDVYLLLAAAGQCDVV